MRKIVAILLAAVLVWVDGPASVLAAEARQPHGRELARPAGFIVDDRYGDFSQLDERLRPLGLFSEESPERTYLCAPACLVNGLHKLRTPEERAAFDPALETERLAKTEGPAAGVPFERMREKGVLPHEFRELASRYMEAVGLRHYIDSWGIHSAQGGAVPLGALRDSVEDGKAVVLSYQYYKENDLLGGHYGVVSGFQAPAVDGEPWRIRLDDPRRGKRTAELHAVPPGRFGAGTFELRFEDELSPKDQLNLVTSLHRITRKEEVHDHDHDHDGHDHHGSRAATVKALLIGGAALAAEIAGGVFTGSAALWADCQHIAIDLFLMGAPLLASRARGKKLDAWLGLAGAGAIAVTAAGIGWEAFHRLLAPVAVPGLATILWALPGLVFNVATVRILHAHKDHSLSLKAAFVHFVGDVLSSAATIASGVLILAAGWLWVDPLMSFFIAGLILYMNGPIFRSAWAALRPGARAAEPARATVGPPELLQTLYGPLDFKEVEFVRRNHAIGPYYGEALRLNPWIPLGDKAALGVDKNGRVFHVLDLGDRTVGYPLGGDRKFASVFLTEAGALFASDPQGNLHQFSRDEWSRSGLRRILKRNFVFFGLIGLGLAAAAFGYMLLQPSGLLAIPLEVPPSLALGLAAAAMLVASLASSQYERQNAVPDGFVALGSRDLSTAVWHPEWAEDFDVQDKHFALPRGIHPKAYEP